MANGQNVAIWIILVVVLAAAAGVIVIAVQNNKREQQLDKVQDAAALYQQKNSSPKPSFMGRPSMRTNTNRVFVPRQGGERYEAGRIMAQAQMANQLPPQFSNSTYSNNVSMTEFAAPPGPAHVMSTTPPNYPPRSGGGALFVPSQSPQAEMPAQQLFVSHSFPSTIDTKLQDLSSISSVNNYSESAAVGTTLSNFTASSYFQDPATMTPNTYADGLGLDAYMPDVSNATPEGLDPQTGLPVFSTASLKRSNQLSSRGLNGFLRPTLDDTQGYKKTVGKRIQTCRYNDCDLDKRRNQFNEARINSNGVDVMPFYLSDFMFAR